MCDQLLEAGLDHASLPTLVNNEMAATDRKRVYKRGGCVLATSRILIVDLLTGRLAGGSIGGFLVGRAHRVSATSQEAFILQIFRDATRRGGAGVGGGGGAGSGSGAGAGGGGGGGGVGFIKAFSEQADSLASGFSHLSKIMRSLHLRRVFLWPRFHVAVTASLKGHEPEVIEVNQPLTRYTYTPACSHPRSTHAHARTHTPHALRYHVCSRSHSRCRGHNHVGS